MLDVTERVVVQLIADGLLLKEIAPGVGLERDILAQMGFRPIVPDEVKLMDAGHFQ